MRASDQSVNVVGSSPVLFAFFPFSFVLFSFVNGCLVGCFRRRR